jgi:pimeloyl-ACP methyl ester carboxylesterase
MPVMTSKDLKINYQTLGPDFGKGAVPVALIHGLGANLAFWYLGASRHLGNDRPILMHDLRGHGASSMPSSGYFLGQLAEDLGQLLNDLGQERTHIVGHSHGARVALAFALQYPDRVASLTIADTQLQFLQPMMRLRDWPHWPAWKAELERQGVQAFPKDDAEMDFRVLAQLGPRGAGVPSPLSQPALTNAMGEEPFTGQNVTRLMRPPGLEGRRINLRSRQMGVRSGQRWQALLDNTTASTELQDESELSSADLSKLKMPTLLLYGAKSHCLPTSEGLLDVIPSARRIVVPEAGHFFPVVKPRLFSRAVNTFIGSIEAPQTADRRQLVARFLAARSARRQAQAF